MSKLLSGIIFGVVITLVADILVGYLVIVNGLIPAAGDIPAGQFEKWAAHSALKAVLKREATEQNPLTANETNLMAGAKVYASNCAGCHGTPIDKTPNFGKGFIPGPTFFGNGDMVTDDPEGYIQWKIEHGIKFTGMPSFKSLLSKKEMWQVTAFLKNMDKLPPTVNTYWNTMK